MRQLLLQYAVVGGMPEAVNTFVDTKQMEQVLQIQKDIVQSYEDDMMKERIRQVFVNAFAPYRDNSARKTKSFNIPL